MRKRRSKRDRPERKLLRLKMKLTKMELNKLKMLKKKDITREEENSIREVEEEEKIRRWFSRERERPKSRQKRVLKPQEWFTREKIKNLQLRVNLHKKVNNKKMKSTEERRITMMKRLMERIKSKIIKMESTGRMTMVVKRLIKRRPLEERIQKMRTLNF